MGAAKKLRKTAKKVAKRERKAVHKLAKHRHSTGGRTIAFLSEVADQPQLVATSIGTMVIGAVARRPDMVRGGARMLAAHLAATAAKALVKNNIDRSRPDRTLKDGRHRLETGGDSEDTDFNSFPSGHTAGAVAVARAASRDIDGMAAPAAIATGAVAAAQPVTGKHYLSDVMAGAVIGWVAEAAVSAVFDRIEPALERRIGQKGR